MVVANASMARALASLALAVAPLASRAGDGALRCDATPRWEDFSTIVMEARTGDAEGQPAMAITLQMDVRDNGVHVVSVQQGRRLELVQLRPAPNDALLASDPAAPMQLVEADMVFGVPVAAAKRQSAGPCALRANTRYPVDFSAGDETISGELELDGNAVRVTVQDKRPRGTVSYAGKLVFDQPRGALPASLPVRGWTIFRHGADPAHAEASRFDTLGDFLNSQPAPAAK